MPNAINSPPNTSAYAPIQIARATAPTAGMRNSNTPKATESRPERPSSHSCSISLRSRTATTISATPVTSDQAATRSTSASAVMLGKKNAISPVATPITPENASQPHRFPSRGARNAAIRLKMPSTRAYAPKRSTSAATAPGGHTRATMPNRTPATPRRTSAHQFSARLLTMCCSATLNWARSCAMCSSSIRWTGLASVDCRVARSLGLGAAWRRGPALDLDPSAPRVLPQGNLDLQHAVLESGGGLVEVRAVGQRDHAREPAVNALGAVDALLLDFDFGPSLAFENERIVPDLDAYVVGRHSREVSAHHQPSVPLHDVDGGRPHLPQRGRGPPLQTGRPAPRTTADISESLEHPVHVLQHAAKEGEGTQADSAEHRCRHRTPLQSGRLPSSLLLPDRLPLSLLIRGLLPGLAGLRRLRAAPAGLLRPGGLRAFHVLLRHDRLHASSAHPPVWRIGHRRAGRNLATDRVRRKCRTPRSRIMMTVT